MKEPRKVLDSKTGTENRTGTEKLEPPSYNLDLEGQPPRAPVPLAQGLAQEYDCRTNLDLTLKLNCLYPYRALNTARQKQLHYQNIKFLFGM